jgi:hypothetical protein
MNRHVADARYLRLPPMVQWQIAWAFAQRGWPGQHRATPETVVSAAEVTFDTAFSSLRALERAYDDGARAMKECIAEIHRFGAAMKALEARRRSVLRREWYRRKAARLLRSVRHPWRASA